MNAKSLLPALIALQLTIAALTLGSFGRGLESGHQAPQDFERNAGFGCVASHATSEPARYRSYQPLIAIGTNLRTCVNFH
jgi:hypothetical protein